MPLIAGSLNFAWEINALLLSRGFYGHVLWTGLDVLIVVHNVRFLEKGKRKKYLLLIVVFILVLYGMFRIPNVDGQRISVFAIRSHVLHLMRGQVFELEGYHFFTMGGAKSHDTEDGILEPGAPDFERKLLMLQRKPRARYRINHISWWAQEMPSEEEYAETRKNLAKVDWAVDYVITHCAPTSIALVENRHNEADPLTDFLQEVKERAHYHYWLFGHYHDNRAIDEKHILLWEQIVQVI